MKILFVSSSSGSLGGGEMFLLFLGMALRDEGHELGLWISSHPRMDKLSSSFSPYGDVIRSEYRNTYDYWHRGLLATSLPSKDRARILGEWQRWAPDIVHFNKQCIEDGLDLLEAASSLKVPHLVTIHITQSAAFLGSKLSAFRDWHAKRALRKYRGIMVAVCDARAEDLRAPMRGTGVQIVAVKNGIPEAGPCTDRKALRRKEGIPDALAVVGVGRLTAQKRPLHFAAQIKNIHDAGVPVYGRWIGDGREKEQWECTVRRLDARSYITLDGWRDDVPTVLPAFDLFLQTSAYEGLSLALLEAMQAGLPCVVAKDSYEQLPENLKACCLALEDSVDWSTLLSNKELLSCLARQGQSLVKSEFQSHTMAEAYMALYRRLTGRSQS
jgi:glycosyltransferase involved in cell wall biosynthesis